MSADRWVFIIIIIAMSLYGGYMTGYETGWNDHTCAAKKEKSDWRVPV